MPKDVRLTYSLVHLHNRLLLQSIYFFTVYRGGKTAVAVLGGLITVGGLAMYNKDTIMETIGLKSPEQVP